MWQLLDGLLNAGEKDFSGPAHYSAVLHIVFFQGASAWIFVHVSQATTSKDLNDEYLAQIKIIIPYIETQSPHHISTWTLRVRLTAVRTDPLRPS